MLTFASLVALAAAMQDRVPPPIRTRPAIPAPAPSASPISRQVSPYTQDTDETWHISTEANWAIRVDRTLGYGCFGLATYDDGTTLRVMVNPVDNRIILGLTNLRWRSLQLDQAYTLQIQFDQHAPWDGEANVVALTPTMKMLHIGIDGEFLGELAESWVFTAKYEGQTLARLDLADSEKMLTALGTCQEAVEEMVDDPFN